MSAQNLNEKTLESASRKHTGNLSQGVTEELREEENFTATTNLNLTLGVTTNSDGIASSANKESQKSSPARKKSSQNTDPQQK